VNIEANKALVRRFYDEVWHRGNVRFAEEVFADDYVRHDLRATKAASGGPGQALIAEQFRRAFPDLEWRVDLLLAEGDLDLGLRSSSEHRCSRERRPRTAARARCSRPSEPA
jgi:predicted SnoaL-like aldol condensation-catalyzing enzyme